MVSLHINKQNPDGKFIIQNYEFHLGSKVNFMIPEVSYS